MSSTELIEQGISDPRKLAVGVSAYIVDLIGASILTTPVAGIVARFEAQFPPKEIVALLDGLSRAYGRCSLERLVWSAKISVAKVTNAIDAGTQLKTKDLAKLLKCREQDVLSEVLSPSGAKLVNDMVIAHVSQKVGEVYLGLLGQAISKGNAKAAELLLGRFDPQHRGASDPTERGGPDFNRMTEQEIVAWIGNTRKQLGEPYDEKWDPKKYAYSDNDDTPSNSTSADGDR